MGRNYKHVHHAITIIGPGVLACAKTTKMEDDKMEDDQNGRRPKWKTTKMEEDQNQIK